MVRHTQNHKPMIIKEATKANQNRSRFLGAKLLFEAVFIHPVNQFVSHSVTHPEV